MQVVHFANSLVDARNELQHKYVQTYYKALDVFFSFWSPLSLHMQVYLWKLIWHWNFLSAFQKYASMTFVTHLFILEISAEGISQDFGTVIAVS